MAFSTLSVTLSPLSNCTLGFRQVECTALLQQISMPLLSSRKPWFESEVGWCLPQGLKHRHSASRVGKLTLVFLTCAMLPLFLLPKKIGVECILMKILILYRACLTNNNLLLQGINTKLFGPRHIQIPRTPEALLPLGPGSGSPCESLLCGSC